MINSERTFELFNYLPNDLLKFSNKQIVYNCDRCGKEKLIRKADHSKGSHKFCKQCGNKDGRSGFARHDFSGKNNSHYKNGYTLKDHFCKEPDCGKKISCRSEYCKKHAVCGDRHPKWKGGISDLHSRIRALENGIRWRKAIFHRDFCTCQKCGIHNVKFDAHHIKSFHQILSEFLSFYSQFSPIEDKETLVRLSISWSDFWDVNNGITLCEDCHKQEHAKIKAKI